MTDNVAQRAVRIAPPFETVKQKLSVVRIQKMQKRVCDAETDLKSNSDGRWEARPGRPMVVRQTSFRVAVHVLSGTEKKKKKKTRAKCIAGAFAHSAGCGQVQTHRLFAAVATTLAKQSTNIQPNEWL